MGMYTEILVKASVNVKKLTNEEKEVLNFLFGGGEKPVNLPKHAFFTKQRWPSIGNMSSFYHHPQSVNSVIDEGEYIFSRSDIKNYDGEIESFFDWFKPLVDTYEGKCIGYKWYEEDDAPTLIYK